MTTPPISPATITPQQRVSLVAGLGTVAIQRDIPAANNAPHLEPEIVPITKEMYDAHAKYLKGLVVWKNDHNCLARASLGVEHINRVHGIGDVASTKQAAAALAIIRKEDNPSLSNADWPFHAGVAVMPKGAREPMIIDYLGNQQPKPLSEWARYYSADPAKIDIRPVFGSWKTDAPNLCPGDFGYVGPASFGWMEENLNATWDKYTRPAASS